MRLVRWMGRENGGWPPDYWRRIGWAEFWCSIDELADAIRAQLGTYSKPDPVDTLEDQVAKATGLRIP
jgi:hypothetical protein